MKICPVHGFHKNNFCEKCKKTCDKNYDLIGRDTKMQKIYNSARWRKIAKSFLRRNPVCVECGYPAQIVDHVVEIKDGGSRYSLDNLQSLCRSCHNTKTAEARAKREGGQKSLKSKSPNTEAPPHFSQSRDEGGTPL